jgi:hypothetical protein
MKRREAGKGEKLLKWHAKGPRIATSCIGTFVLADEPSAFQPQEMFGSGRNLHFDSRIG